MKEIISKWLEALEDVSRRFFNPSWEIADRYFKLMAWTTFSLGILAYGKEVGSIALIVIAIVNLTIVIYAITGLISDKNDSPIYNALKVIAFVAGVISNFFWSIPTPGLHEFMETVEKIILRKY